jgi:large subunit ribosomal protein L24
VEKEAPLYSARVMLVCPKCGHAARVAHGYLADGTKIRVCKNCGEQIEK